MLLLATISSLHAEVDVNYIHTLNSNRSVTLGDVENNPHGYSVDEVIETLRAMDEKYTSSHSEVLIRLRDQHTIDKYIERFVKYKGADRRSLGILAGSRAPWLIPVLMEYADTTPIEMREHPNPEMLLYYGLSGSVVDVIDRILSRSEDLTPEVNQWASGINLRGEQAMKDAQRTYLKWWEVNKTAFEAEDYKRVVPLAENINIEIPSDPPVQEVVEEVTQESTAPAPATVKPSEVETAEPIEEPVEQSSNWWLWLIGAVVVVVGIGLVACRKS